MSGNLIQANAIQIPLQDESVQLCCFSPPYWKLRKYRIPNIEFPDGWTGQLGLEPSMYLLVDHMMLVMGEVCRVLRDDGVCFVNIGTTLASKNLESEEMILRDDLTPKEIEYVKRELKNAQTTQTVPYL